MWTQQTVPLLDVIISYITWAFGFPHCNFAFEEYISKYSDLYVTQYTESYSASTSHGRI